MIRKCTEADFEAIYGIINDAAEAYRGIIPADRWHEPYMSREQLKQEIDADVQFWGFEEDSTVVAVMGIQDKGEVTLIRHAYVISRMRNRGIGSRLLRFLESATE
ncbi:MAG: GNAT family N-acetyltransferase, partial [Thermodesulfobacteriota bacterium]